MTLLAVTTLLTYFTAPGAAFLDSRLGLLNNLLEPLNIFAVETGTLLEALLALTEAFTVHLQAEGFLACAPSSPLSAAVSGCLH